MHVGYHASHEQHPPADLLEYVRLAARAGFDRAMCSDHIAPFTESQGHSGFAWSWLGAALEATGMRFGTVNAPGQRYHPAVIAQAAATLGAMYPGRFWLALGSGEFLNEHVTGQGWPPKPERNRRLRECVDVIRRLWSGETVDHDGLVRVEQTRLYVGATPPPPIFAAAITAETARWAGGWADGLITVGKDPDTLREVTTAFREGGGGTKPLLLQMQIAWAPDEERALRAAVEEWPTSVLAPSVVADLRLPEDIAAAAAIASPELARERMRVTDSGARVRDWIDEAEAVGFDEVYVHNVYRDQRWFIDSFAREVIAGRPGAPRATREA